MYMGRKKTNGSFQLGVPLPEEYSTTVDKLVADMSGEGKSFTRADIWRMAIHRGLADLALENSKKKSKR